MTTPFRIELSVKRNNSVSMTLEKCIERYGKKEGTKKYFEKIKKLAYKNTIEFYVEKYGIEEGPIKYNEWKNKCVCSLPNFIKKSFYIRNVINFIEN